MMWPTFLAATQQSATIEGMPKTTRAAARRKSSAAVPAKAAPKLASKPAAKLAPKIVEKSVRPAPIPAADKTPIERRPDPMMRRGEREVTCRSCGIRPGRPTAIIGQLTATELCEVCANLRKERIRQNRAQQRGYRL